MASASIDKFFSLLAIASFFALLLTLSCASQSTVQQKANMYAISWSKTFGGNEKEEGEAIAQTLDGYIVVGYTESTDGNIKAHYGKSDLLVMKLNANGDKLWSETFGGSSNDYGGSLTVMSDGSILVAGSSSSSDGDLNSNKGYTDLWVLKLDSNGNKLWSKTYGGKDHDSGGNIVVTSNGNIAITGHSWSNDGDLDSNKGFIDLWILTLDSTGNKLWSKTYGGNGYDVGSSFALTKDEGFIITGYTTSDDLTMNNNKGFSDLWVLRLDSAGNKLWSKTYLEGYESYSNSMAVNNEGNIAIIGQTWGGASRGDSDLGDKVSSKLWLLKLDISGNKLWSKTYEGSDDNGEYIKLLPSGGYAIAGFTYKSDRDVNGKKDGWYMQLDKNGDKVWSRAYGSSVCDHFSALTATTDGIVLIGSTEGNDGDIKDKKEKEIERDDIWVVKLKTQ